MIKIIKSDVETICTSCKSEIDVYDIKITLPNNSTSQAFPLCRFCLQKLKLQIEKEIE